MHSNDREKLLNKALDELPRLALPERELWPGIEHALHEPAPVDWYRTSALAASVLLIVSLSLYFGMLQPLDSQHTKPLAELLSALQQEHQSSVQTMLTKYQGKQPYYADWQVQMTQLQQAEEAIYKALNNDPENLELLKLLRQMQTRQLELIDAVFAPRLTTI